MADIWKLIRENVKTITPYSPGKSSREVMEELGLSEVTKLASNENPLGPSAKAIAAMQATLPEVGVYPDPTWTELRGALAEFYETDGDTGKMVVSVPPNQMYVSTLYNMFNAPVGGQVVMAMAQTGGGGTLGDAQCYAVACTQFDADGFMFMGNWEATQQKGESMGYLPRWDRDQDVCTAAE